MTYSAALAASVIRSALVVIVGLAAANILAVWFESTPSSRLRRLKALAIALPFLTPNLVVGYGYRGLSLNLLRWPWVNESLYFALVCFELVPAAIWMLINTGSPTISAEAMYCARLGQAQTESPLRSAWEWFRLWRRGPASRYFAPAALLFVLSFQEGELAALMQVASWTERVFTDHTRGLPAISTMQLVVWPVVIQAAVLWPVLRFLGENRGNGGLRQPSRNPARSRLIDARISRGFGIAWIALATLAVIAVPLSHMTRSAAASARTVFLQPMWLRELGDALLVAVTCAGFVWFLAAFVKRSRKGGRSLSAAPMLTASLAPGLMGTLALGLIVAAGFQRFLPHWAYTPLPLVVAEIAWLWPRAVVVWRTLEGRTGVINQQTRLLANSPLPSQRRHARLLWWRFRGQTVCGGAILVGWWCYLETMLPTLLSPPGFQPAPMVLYNHLHYGQIAALGVKLAMILAAPAVLLGLPWLSMSRTGRRSST